MVVSYGFQFINPLVRFVLHHALPNRTFESPYHPFGIIGLGVFDVSVFYVFVC